MMKGFYWWVDMKACTRCGYDAASSVRHKNPLAKRFAGLHSPPPLPNSPGYSVSVDYIGPLPIAARGSFHIDLFTDRFSRREDMFAVAAAVFTAEGSNILVNRFIPFWGGPPTLLSGNGLQCCAQLATAAYKLINVHKLTISAYHPSGNGGVERVNGRVWVYDTATTTRQGPRKSADSKVLKKKLSLR